MSEGEETKTTVNGTVEEVLPNSLFRVRLSVPANPSSEALAKEDEVSEQPHFGVPCRENAFASYPRSHGRPSGDGTLTRMGGRARDCTPINIDQWKNESR